MAMITPAGCIAGAKSIVESVPGVGIVHNYRRIIRTEQDVKTLLYSGGKVNAWMVGLSGDGTALSKRNPGHHGVGVKGGGNVLTTFQVNVEGYYGISDAGASEVTFRNLAWAVADEFNAYGIIPGVDGLVMQGPAQLFTVGYSLLASTFLFHYCRMTLDLQGRTR